MALTRQQKQELISQYADLLSSGKDVVLIEQK
jgi:ribosomal protein L10